MFGAYMLGQTLVYAPSFNSARVCAGRIIGLIYKVPEVRTEDGVIDKKDWVNIFLGTNLYLSHRPRVIEGEK